MPTVAVNHYAVAEAWTTEGDGYRCTRHGEKFTRLEVCPRCALEPPSSQRTEEIVALPTPPENCFTSEQWEKWFSDVAGKAQTLAYDLAKHGADGKKRKRDRAFGVEKVGKTPREHTACAKYLELAVKAANRASEMAQRREDEHTVRERERRLRERGHGGVH